MINQDLQFKLRKAGYEGGLELSELIKACGDKFYKLEQNDNQGSSWSAFEFKIEWKSGECRWVSGETPEEAVASLYIKLNSVKMKEWDNKKEKNTGTGKEIK